MKVLETLGLEAYGFTPEQITQIDGALVEAQHIVATYQLIKPRIDRVIPVVRMILDVVNKQEHTP